MMIGHASEPLFSSLERVEKGRAAAAAAAAAAALVSLPTRHAIVAAAAVLYRR